MRPAKLLRRLGGAAAARQRHMVGAVTVAAALLIVIVWSRSLFAWRSFQQSLRLLRGPPPPLLLPLPAPAPAPAPAPTDPEIEDLTLPPLSLLPLPLPQAAQPAVNDTSFVSTQPQAYASQLHVFHPEAPLWPSPADHQLLLANKLLQASPPVASDPDLHAPLFTNLSTFKWSYQLMENTLKVYIYQEGEKPIFHTPELKGIYASEGWFMKLLEGSKQYTTKDPTRAHLFYLPYSSRRLEYALYVPGSHTILSLSKFVKGYVEMLSAKYPFWNRTKGADHFFVACHDWGPYTTKLHEELRKNTIKALCNADTSEGVFIQGKDVSLPETFIKFPKRPQRDVGGKPVSQRTILAFFAGQMHGRVRPVLVRHWGNNRDPDMRVYARLPKITSKKMSYSEHMKSSKYCICPMGYEVNSPRIVEAIYNGCVPVIIADHFVLPFDEVLNWSEFSLVVLEKDIPKLKEILVGISQKRYMDLWMNVNRVQRHFLWHMKPEKYDLFHMVLHSIWLSRLNQIQAS